MGNHSLSESSMPGLPHGALNHFSPQVGECLWARGPGTCGRFRLFAGGVLWGAAYYWWPDFPCDYSYMFIDVWYMTGTIILDMSGDPSQKNSFPESITISDHLGGCSFLQHVFSIHCRFQYPAWNTSNKKMWGPSTFQEKKQAWNLVHMSPTGHVSGCRGVSAQDCWKVLQKLCR